CRSTHRQREYFYENCRNRFSGFWCHHFILPAATLPERTLGCRTRTEKSTDKISSGSCEFFRHDPHLRISADDYHDSIFINQYFQQLDYTIFWARNLSAGRVC